MNQIQKHLASDIAFTKAVVCYLKKGNKVLLGLRKRVSLGLGENLISGIGGKVGDTLQNQYESLEQALEREVLEEIGVSIKVFRKMGRVKFIFPHKLKWNQDVLVYVVESWEGEPTETQDIKPLWFDVDQLPFSKMWDDNRFWVPEVLKGKEVDAVFLYDEDNSRVLESAFG